MTQRQLDGVVTWGGGCGEVSPVGALSQETSCDEKDVADSPCGVKSVFFYPSP